MNTMLHIALLAFCGSAAALGCDTGRESTSSTPAFSRSASTALSPLEREGAHSTGVVFEADLELAEAGRLLMRAQAEKNSVQKEILVQRAEKLCRNVLKKNTITKSMSDPERARAKTRQSRASALMQQLEKALDAAPSRPAHAATKLRRPDGKK